MSSRPSRMPGLFAVALLSLSASAFAAPRDGRNAPPPAPPRGGMHHDSSDALSDSVRRIERSTRGQVLSAERVPFDGRDVNRIKTVDAQGRVRVYMDDPADARRGSGQSPRLADPPSD